MSVLEKLKNFADRTWYVPLIGVLAAVDLFIVILPIEWLMIPGVLMKPRRWLPIALVITTGSALGSLALAALAQAHGPAFIENHLPSLIQSIRWKQSSEFIQLHGPLALLVIAGSPLPQQPAVAFAGLSKMSLPLVFSVVWVGRALKYCFVAWAASHAPKLLAKLPGGKKLVKEVEEIKG